MYKIKISYDKDSYIVSKKMSLISAIQFGRNIMTYDHVPFKIEVIRCWNRTVAITAFGESEEVYFAPSPKIKLP